MMKKTISQCIIVKNEEKNIRRALSWGKDIAEGKGVHREVESEGSRMWEQTNHGQISGLTNRNYIEGHA